MECQQISSWDRSFVLMSFLGVKKIFYHNLETPGVHSLSAPEMLDVNCLLCSAYLVKAAVYMYFHFILT